MRVDPIKFCSAFLKLDLNDGNCKPTLTDAAIVSCLAGKEYITRQEIFTELNKENDDQSNFYDRIRKLINIGLVTRVYVDDVKTVAKRLIAVYTLTEKGKSFIKRLH